jgi:nuclear GTP-binding protein
MIDIVEEILYRTEHEKLQSIYNLPQFTSTLEFLTMLALSSGRLLKVSAYYYLSYTGPNDSRMQGGTPDVLAAARQVLGDWNAQKIPYHSIPPAIHPSSIPSQVVLPGASSSEVVVAPGAENVGQAQILSTLGPAFNLGDLFGAADAGAFGGENGDAMEADVEDDGAELMDEDG